MEIVNSFVNDIFSRITIEAGRLAVYNVRILHPFCGYCVQYIRSSFLLLVCTCRILLIPAAQLLSQLIYAQAKKTISSRETQTAVRLILPGELAKHAVSEGTKAVTKYSVSMSKENPSQPEEDAASDGEDSEDDAPAFTGSDHDDDEEDFANSDVSNLSSNLANVSIPSKVQAAPKTSSSPSHPASAASQQKSATASNKPVSRSTRAGLVFPIGRISRSMRAISPGKRIGAGAPVYLAGVLEYLSAEILELAGNAARDNKKLRIVPRHLQLAIRNDAELNRLLESSVVPSNVLPVIHDLSKIQPSTASTPDEKPVEASVVEKASAPQNPAALPHSPSVTDEYPLGISSI